MRLRLRQSILEATKRGFVAGNLEAQLAHTEEFVEVVASLCPGEVRGVDLGSGGGLPGLGLLLGLPELRLWLVEAQQRRARFLEEQIEQLGLGERAVVRHGRAEEIASEDGVAGSFGLVTARSFGPPATTAEIGARFLAVGGVLVASDPPGSDGSRWDGEGLGLLGLVLEDVAGRAFRFAVLRRGGPAQEGYPRSGIKPFKRPVF